jgi:hypothetical protein
MAADHTTYYALLHALLGAAPSLIIRRGNTPHGELGIVQHANNIVTIHQDAAPQEFAGALIRATVDLHRGSVRAPDQKGEAAKVREAAARIAVHSTLALLPETVKPDQLARALGVDIETVLLGIQLAGGVPRRLGQGM